MRTSLIAFTLALVIATPATADTIRDRSGRFTGTIEKLGDGAIVKDRRGKVTAIIECSSNCFIRDRSGRITGTIERPVGGIFPQNPFKDRKQ